MPKRKKSRKAASPLKLSNKALKLPNIDRIESQDFSIPDDLNDILDISRKRRVLYSTRSHSRALTSLLSSPEDKVALPNVAYTLTEQPMVVDSPNKHTNLTHVQASATDDCPLNISPSGVQLEFEYDVDDIPEESTNAQHTILSLSKQKFSLDIDAELNPSTVDIVSPSNENASFSKSLNDYTANNCNATTTTTEFNLRQEPTQSLNHLNGVNPAKSNTDSKLDNAIPTITIIEHNRLIALAKIENKKHNEVAINKRIAFEKCSTKKIVYNLQLQLKQQEAVYLHLKTQYEQLQQEVRPMNSTRNKPADCNSNAHNTVIRKNITIVPASYAHVIPTIKSTIITRQKT